MSDPLSEALPSAAKRTGAPRKFASGEHVWLGDAGASAAAISARAQGIKVGVNQFKRIKRLHGKEAFRYGELVALSGDFYGRPEDLYEEKESLFPRLWEQNDVSDLKALFNTELDWIEARQQGKKPEVYPNLNVRMAWNAKWYVELALDNVDHFGWHNMKAYCRYHAAALDLAVRANGQNNELWSRAIVYNAFADHFLSDAFAAGHVRVPRAEIREWAARIGVSVKLAGALSKLLHDQDGHVETLHGAADDYAKDTEGLPVVSADGTRWRTFCDGQLFLKVGAEKAPAVEQPVKAIAASVGELLTAWSAQTRPSGAYAASQFVPFPHASAQPLVEKFSPQDTRQIERLHKSADWYVKIPWIGPGLERAHIERLFSSLPDLMQQFRANVQADLARDPELRSRLPAAYSTAFANLR